MKRVRLSTLLLLVLIAALSIGLIVLEQRHRRHEAASRAEQARLELQLQMHDMNERNLMGAIKILQANQEMQQILQAEPSATPGKVAGDGDGR